MTLLKIIVFLIFWKWIIKAVLLTYLFIIWQVWKLLSKKEKNFSIKPMRAEFDIPNFNLHITYVFLNNLIFDLTYKIISKGWWGFFEKTRLWAIIIRLVFLYFGVSYLMLIIIWKIIKGENFATKMINSRDNRIIIKREGKWELNNGFLVFWNKLSSRSSNLSEPAKDKLKTIMKNYYDKTEELFASIKIKQNLYLFIEKDKPSIAHKGSIDWPSDKTKIGYETSYFSAVQKNFYGRKILIKKFEGSSKETTLLETDTSKVIIKKEFPGNFDIREKIIGSQLSEYDKFALDNRITSAIEEFEKLEKNLEIELSSHDELYLFYKIEKSFILHSMEEITHIEELSNFMDHSR